MQKTESNLVQNNYKPIFVYDEMRTSYLSYAMSVIVSRALPDVINTTNKNLKRSNPQLINDIYKQDRLIVDFSDKMKMIDKQIKDFLKRNMYNHKKVVVNTNRGKRIINDLFKYLSKNSRKHISKDLFKNEQKERVIADFIAGMTDRYAINLYKKVK